MTEVSTFRLYLMRATYLLIAAGLGFTIWPQIIHHPQPWPLWHGVGCSLLGAVSVLAALGIRYPLKMIPVFLFELVWKAIWLAAIAYPLWSSHQMDADTWGTVQDCFMAVIFLLVVPWPYVFANFVKKSGDRWR